MVTASTELLVMVNVKVAVSPTLKVPLWSTALSRSTVGHIGDGDGLGVGGCIAVAFIVFHGDGGGVLIASDSVKVTV